MVMPERLPTPLPFAPEVSGSTVPAARVVVAPKVASAEFTAISKRRSFTAKYKLQILMSCAAQAIRERGRFLSCAWLWSRVGRSRNA